MVFISSLSGLTGSFPQPPQGVVIRTIDNALHLPKGTLFKQLPGFAPFESTIPEHTVREVAQILLGYRDETMIYTQADLIVHVANTYGWGLPDMQYWAR